MNKINLKSLFVVVLCSITLSCSFISENSGKLSFSIPDKISIENKSVTTSGYSVILTDASDGTVFLNQQQNENNFIITNIPVGIYNLEVSCMAGGRKYVGNENNIQILPGRTKDVKIVLQKENVITDFSVSLTDFGKKVDVAQYTGDKTLTSIIDNPGNLQLKYQWQYSTINAGECTDIEGANGTSYKVPNNETGTKYYQIRVTDNNGVEKISSVEVEVHPWNLTLNNAQNLVGGQDYSVILTNKATTNHTGITFESNNSDFVINKDTGSLKAPAAVPGKDQTAVISAKYGNKEIAKLDVKVLAEGKTLTGIEAKLSDSVTYIEYGKTVTSDMFTITEVYNTGSEPADSANYNVEAEKSLAAGNKNSFVISKISDPSVNCKVQNVVCKYNIQTPTVTVTAKNDTVDKDATTKPKLTAAVTFANEDSTLTSYYDTYAYQWKKKIDTGEYKIISGANAETYEVPTDTVEKATYNCEVTVTANTSTTDYCLDSNGKKASDSTGVIITINEPTPTQPSNTAANLTELRNLITSGTGPVDITLTENITLDADGIVIGTVQSKKLIGRDVTIRASKSITISRGTCTANPMFKIGKDCQVKILGTSTNKITIDGGGKSGTTQIIKSFGNLEIDNCILQNNGNSKNSGNKDLFGGAIYLGWEKNGAQPTSGNLDLTMKNSTVQNISCGKAGAIYLSGNNSYTITSTINNCEIINNKNINQGAINCEHTGTATPSVVNITETRINDNKADSNGGGIAIQNTKLNLNKVTIQNNSANNGAGINVLGSLSVVKLENNTIIQNNNSTIANNSFSGIGLNAGKLEIISGTISGNTANGAPVNLYINKADPAVTVKTNKGTYTHPNTSSKTFANDITQDTDISMAN